ncbi:MAG: hypothetical protein WC879_03360 [Melioribacteraceae bacterium]
MNVLDQAKNGVEVTVSTGYDDTATSIVLASGEGAKLPDPASGNFNLIWYNSTDYKRPFDDPNVEIIRVTAKTTDTLTIVRPAVGNSYNGEGSTNTAKTHNIGGKTYKMILSLTSKTINDIDGALINGATTDVTTNDASTTKHGWLLKLIAPATGLINYIGIAYGETIASLKALFDATVPSTQAFGDSAAVGTASVAARRDHKHAMPSESVASTTVSGIAELTVETEVAAGTDTTRIPRVADIAQTISKGSFLYAADAGTTDAYAITLVPAPSAYVTGAVYHFKANTINTGACTLNVNALGVITIKKQYNVDLADGDIKAGQLCSVIYDGTNFQLLSQTSAAAATYVYKTADEIVNNSITLQDDNHLVFALGANETWTITYFIIYHASGVADFKHQFTVPTGATGRWNSHGMNGGYAFQWRGTITEVGAGNTGESVSALIILTAYIKTSTTAGNITLQWAQNTAEVSDTTVFEGSHLEAKRLSP